MEEEGKLRRDRGCKVDKAEISGGSRQDLRGQPHLGFMELQASLHPVQREARPEPKEMQGKGGRQELFLIEQSDL